MSPDLIFLSGPGISEPLAYNVLLRVALFVLPFYDEDLVMDAVYTQRKEDERLWELYRYRG